MPRPGQHLPYGLPAESACGGTIVRSRWARYGRRWTPFPSGSTVAVLRDVEGWTSEEVSAALLTSAGDQRVLLHRGRARMRELLLPHVDAFALR